MTPRGVANPRLKKPTALTDPCFVSFFLSHMSVISHYYDVSIIHLICPLCENRHGNMKIISRVFSCEE